MLEKQHYKCNNSYEKLKKEYCDVFGWKCEKKITKNKTVKKRNIPNSNTFRQRRRIF